MLNIYDVRNRPDPYKLLAVYEDSIVESMNQNYAYMSDYEKRRNAEDAILVYIRYEFFQVSGAQYAVWQEGDRYLSAVRIEPYLDGYLLSGLETLPEVRGCGYATLLLSSLIARYSEAESLVVYSHVRKNNTQSLKVHEKIGFQTVRDSVKLLDGSVSNEYFTLKYGK